MSAGTAIYGVNPDGSVSRCRAKDPAHCRYHKNNDGTAAKHMQLTESQANAMNEAAARANAMPEGNALQRAAKADAQGMVRSIASGLDGMMDGDKAYDKAMSAMKAMDSLVEDEYREPIKTVNQILPPVTPTDGKTRNEVVDREISELRSQDYKNLAGHRLRPEEETMVYDRLKEYAGRKIERGSGAVYLWEDGPAKYLPSLVYTSNPTPAEERALLTLTSNPDASDEVMTKMAGDEEIMSFGAKFVESSPYASEQAKDLAFKTNPIAALESPMLASKHVNEVLDSSMEDADQHYGELVNVMRHPNASPEKVYSAYMALDRSSTSTGVYNPNAMRYLDWQIAMNPNVEFRRKIAEMDDDGILEATRAWRREHSEENSPVTAG